jgi:hypothetical protein
LNLHNLDSVRRRANRADAALQCARHPHWAAVAVLAATVLLGACTPPPDPFGKPPPSNYPELGEFPARPTPPDTDEERRQASNELLTDLARQRYAMEELRYRVGLTRSRPSEPVFVPSLPPPDAPVPPPPLPPSENLEARFLRQQIRAEIESDSLNDFLDRVAAEPVVLDPLAANELPAEEPSAFFGGEDTPPKSPEYPDWSGYVPLLDRLFARTD